MKPTCDALLAPNGGNKFPGFSDDPLDAFRDLAYDLEDVLYEIFYQAQGKNSRVA